MCKSAVYYKTWDRDDIFVSVMRGNYGWKFVAPCTRKTVTLIFFSNYPEEAYNCMTLKIIMTINFGLVFVKLHIPLFSMEKII